MFCVFHEGYDFNGKGSGRNQRHLIREQSVDHEMHYHPCILNSVMGGGGGVTRDTLSQHTPKFVYPRKHIREKTHTNAKFLQKHIISILRGNAVVVKRCPTVNID